MGIVNTTPDSFSDGGAYNDARRAAERIDTLLAQGADIIDIGAESTRPGAPAVSADEQIARARPALEHALSRGAWTSIDTTSAEVASFALGAGAHVVNDVSCLADPTLARLASEHDAVLLLMHSRGSMTDMPSFSAYPRDAYGDVVREIAGEWSAARERALGMGLAARDIWFDPGLGFHKNAEQSAEILRRFEEFSDLGALSVVGPSNKSFIGALDQSSVNERLGGTIAACLRAVRAGASILRVHDVKTVRQALLAARAFERERGRADA